MVGAWDDVQLPPTQSAKQIGFPLKGGMIGLPSLLPDSVVVH